MHLGKIEITIAEKGHLDQIRGMLRNNDLPIDDIDNPLIQFFVAQEQDHMVGVIGVELFQKLGLLRSLSVREAFKSKKIGSQLVEYLLNHCANKGVADLFLLTTTAASFFEKFGFEKIEREEVPAAIQATKEFSSICPMSATVMRKKLNH